MEQLAGCGEERDEEERDEERDEERHEGRHGTRDLTTGDCSMCVLPFCADAAGATVAGEERVASTWVEGDEWRDVGLNCEDLQTSAARGDERRTRRLAVDCV